MFQVDAFTAERFRGNPAAVIPLQAWLSDELMQAIAAENNLSETAFFVREADGAFHIRWFSPLTEIDFCGHATLASAFVLLEQGLAQAPLVFRAAAVGDLTVQRRADGLLEMSFPNRAPEPVAEPPAALLQGLGCEPEAVLRSQQAWFAVYRDEQQVRALSPDLDALRGLAPLDVVVTAPGREQDFVSRYFWPANGGDEDPVTGSIHAGLAPYWAGQLGRNELVALQASARTGILHCRVEADRVMVAGQAVLFLDGTIEL
ncbi:PhzF family phenazine biosynthesis protein [Stutzerimonas decontaminans]|uniref:PhzF family phenazine biosynthesis protein n=2 Tax=Stutzerimonas TaxID=2901164 RepID=A0ABX4W547_9GAMM|nr:PhzF family phenazine biosynthesis protein [Stutzerimonas decontaminans]AHY42312.1 phenazine biosynthesis protein PhzF [Stutzerimonas decontaminans]MCQ4246139.1 PhzF family phenazine biosynthesis protein [Stutzerimonas decontaminans]PNF86606.1 PhzF family phenazine biosynthesis protein [Stutzerimonas decontaminans]